MTSLWLQYELNQRDNTTQLPTCIHKEMNEDEMMSRAESAGHFKNPRIQIWILYPYICHLYPNWLATLARNLASLANGQLTQS